MARRFGGGRGLSHLAQALGQVVRRLGGTAQRWRFDRMSTVCYPSSGQATAAFAAVAKYDGVGVDICPPRHGNRRGVAEKANHSAVQRWWRTQPDDLTVEQAQSGADKLALRTDERRRRLDGAVTTVGELASAEPLLDPSTAGRVPDLAPSAASPDPARRRPPRCPGPPTHTSGEPGHHGRTAQPMTGRNTCAMPCGVSMTSGG